MLCYAMLWRTIVNYFDQTVFMKLRNSVKTERLEKWYQELVLAKR